mgnify:FL=1
MDWIRENISSISLEISRICIPTVSGILGGLPPMESSHSKNVSITANCKNSRKLTVFLYTVLFDAYTTPSVWAVFFLPGTGYESLMLSFRYELYHFPKCCLLWWFFFPFHKINSKLSNFLFYQFEGLHNLWDTPDKRDDEWATGRAGTLERKTPLYQKSHTNYSKKLQPAKDWSYVISHRIIICQLQFYCIASAENKSFPAIRFCSIPRWTHGFSGHPDRFLLVDINAQHHPVELLPCKAANIRSIPWPAIVPLCSQPLVDQGDTVRLFHDCFDPVTSAVAEQKEHGGYSWKNAPVCLHIIHRLTCPYWSCRR